MFSQRWPILNRPNTGSLGEVAENMIRNADYDERDDTRALELRLNETVAVLKAVLDVLPLQAALEVASQLSIDWVEK